MTGSFIIALIGYGLAVIFASVLPMVLVVIVYDAVKGAPNQKLWVSGFWGAALIAFLGMVVAAFTRWASGV